MIRRLIALPMVAGALKGAGAVGGLCVVLTVALASNRPPLGIYVFGAVIGLLYALVAFGLILVYRANRIVNFANAEIGAAAAVLAVLLMKSDVGLGYLPALGLAVGAAAVAGLLVERFVVRRFAHAPRLLLSVATIGLALVFAAIQLFLPPLITGRFVDPSPPQTPFSGITAEIGGFVFSANHVVVVIVTLALSALLGAFFRYTDVGVSVRAVADNRDRAALLGVPVGRVNAVVWVLSSVLAAVAVFLRAPVIGLPVGVAVGPTVLLFALAAAVVGRMERFGVALVAAVCLGILEQGLFYWNRDAALGSAIVLPVLLVVMLLQRGGRSRALDSGVETWSNAEELRPVPVELRHLPLVRWGRRAVYATALLAAIAIPPRLDAFQLNLASLIVIYAIVAVSVVVLTGWAGQVSLGQWGFVGIGAAAAGGLATHAGADFIVSIAAAGIAGALAAVIVGVPALRLRGLHLAVTTLGFAIAVQVWLLSPSYSSWLLPDAVGGIPRPVLYRRFDLADDRAFLTVAVVVLVVALLSARSLRNSATGRALVAVRDNERGARSMSISTWRAKLGAFAVSGFWAGVGGGLFAFHQGAVDQGSFGPTVSLDVLVMTVIGGVTSLSGAVIGPFVIGFLRYGQFAAQTQLLATGVGVLLVLLVLPGGLAQLLFGSRDRLLRWLAARHRINVPTLTADRAPEDGAAAPAVSAALGEGGVRPLLSLRSLAVTYANVQVVFGVDLDVAEGEIVALLGTNGAGKSTILKAAMGLAPVTGGTVTFDGVDVTTTPTRDRVAAGMACMPGGRAVFPTLTVDECLRVAGAFRRRRDPAGATEDRRRVIAQFPVLAQRAGELAGDLSGGEQQMLGLAMAFLSRPRLLMIDELSLGLAPSVVAELVGFVGELHERGTTVIVVEQSTNVALLMAQRAVFLEKGEVRFSGPTAELIGREDVLRAVFLEGAGAARVSSRATAPPPSSDVPAGAPVLELSGVRRSFGGVTAVAGVDLAVDRGEILGIIGPNGAGKTTLMDLISGHIEPDEGRVLLGGRDVTASAAEVRASSGLYRSFQDARLFPALTVSENIAIGLSRHLLVRDPLAACLGLPEVRASEDDAGRAVDDLVELFGLGAYRYKLVGELSTGTRRIVDLAMVVGHAPEVLLLDEPSSGVAQRETEALVPLLERIRTETGCAMVVIEHDIPLVTEVSDRMVAMVLGAVIATGAPHDVITNPGVVAAYLGRDDRVVRRSNGRRRAAVKAR